MQTQPGWRYERYVLPLWEKFGKQPTEAGTGEEALLQFLPGNWVGGHSTGRFLYLLSIPRMVGWPSICTKTPTPSKPTFFGQKTAVPPGGWPPTILSDAFQIAPALFLAPQQPAGWRLTQDNRPSIVIIWRY